MRNISFSMTTAQIQARTKTVTRRAGWLKLKPGDRLRGVKKAMGLKKGETIEPLAEVIVTSVRRERLDAMLEDMNYGKIECDLEGFGQDPVLSCPIEFVAFFCAGHKGCEPSTVVTRIEFEYANPIGQ